MKKKILAALSLLLVSASAGAYLLHYPFQPEVDKRFNTVEGEHSVQATLKPNPYNGQTPQGTYDTGVAIPANTIFTSGYITFVQGYATSSGTVNVAFGCGTQGSIIATAFNPAASGNTAGSILILPKLLPAGGGPNTPYFLGSTAAPCDITAVVSGTAGALYQQGQLNLILHYIDAH